MFRQAVCTSFKRANRVGLRPRYVLLICPTRRYTVSSLYPSVSSKLAPLPTAPDPSTDPLVESDFPQYLAPLYDYGWAFDLSRESYRDDKPEDFTILRRTFLFQTPMELAAFTASTRNAPLGSISVFRNLMTEVQLRSHKGVTRSVIRLALEAETEYQKIVGSDSRPPAEPDFKVMTLQQAQSLILRKPLHRRAPPVLFPIVPVALPPAPPAPAFPPPSITEADLKTYIAPLVLNGWRVGGIKPMRKRFNEATKALRNSPCLHRIYHFTDYPSARQFLTAIVAAIPVQPLDTLAGAEVWLSFEKCTLELWSLSELAERPPETEDADYGPSQQYGISHADLRFAIEVENEFIKNWVGHANHAAAARKLPTRMDELWGFSPRTKEVGAVVQEPPEE